MRYSHDSAETVGAKWSKKFYCATDSNLTLIADCMHECYIDKGYTYGFGEASGVKGAYFIELPSWTVWCISTPIGVKACINTLLKKQNKTNHNLLKHLLMAWPQYMYMYALLYHTVGYTWDKYDTGLEWRHADTAKYVVNHRRAICCPC